MIQRSAVTIVGHPLVFARFVGSDLFDGIARCECGVEYTGPRSASSAAAAADAARYADRDGWDVRAPDHVVCPWCLESVEYAAQ